jgi:hypothetical protein
MRNSINTLEILRELDFIYFIDDLSRDEPFIIPLPNGEIGVVPYTAHLNDLHNLLPVYDLAQFDLYVAGRRTSIVSMRRPVEVAVSNSSVMLRTRTPCFSNSATVLRMSRVSRPKRSSLKISS